MDTCTRNYAIFLDNATIPLIPQDIPALAAYDHSF